MGTTHSIHFRKEDEEIREYMEQLHEDGPFRSRSHVVVVALEQLQDQKTENILI